MGTIRLNRHDGRPCLLRCAGRLLRLTNYIGELAYCTCFKQDSKFEVCLISLFYLGKQTNPN